MASAEYHACVFLYPVRHINMVSGFQHFKDGENIRQFNCVNALVSKSGKAMLFKRLDFPDAVCFGTILSLGGMPFTGYVFKGVCKVRLHAGLLLFCTRRGQYPPASSRLASSRFSRAIFRVMAGYSPKLSSFAFSVKTIVHAPQPAASFGHIEIKAASIAIYFWVFPAVSGFLWRYHSTSGNLSFHVWNIGKFFNNISAISVCYVQIDLSVSISGTVIPFPCSQDTANYTVKFTGCKGPNLSPGKSIAFITIWNIA